LPENRIWTCRVDGNNIWIGTLGGGLAKFDGTNWTVYDTSNSMLSDNGVLALAVDGNNIWIGTGGGLGMFDGTNWTEYNESNSSLPDNSVRSLAIDDNDNIWIGTYEGGLAKFDGINWTVYNTTNSGLPNNEILALAADGSNIWIGTWGLVKFDGNIWTEYNESNSELPYNRIFSLATDGNGNIWIGTYGGGLANFDGTNWSVYQRSNSGLPDDLIVSLAIDGINTWIGTWGGLAKFDGIDWKVYNTSNSGLPDNWVYGVAIDGSNNIWIGTGLGGLAVYREGGVIINIEQENNIKKIPTEFSLSQNYPNPFNPSTTIRFALPRYSPVELKVFDIRGREVARLVDEELNPGEYKVIFEAKDLSSGIYFYRIITDEVSITKKMILLQ
jgi:ligand-binding sensor domain-containing protein